MIEVHIIKDDIVLSSVDLVDVPVCVHVAMIPLGVSQPLLERWIKQKGEKRDGVIDFFVRGEDCYAPMILPMKFSLS